MRFDKFTIKGQEALQEAQAVAEKHEHQQVEPEHLLLALLQQREGIIPQVFQKLGVSLPALSSSVEKALEAIPKVYGGGVGQAYISPRLKKVLDGSLQEAERLKDTYVSTEHMLLAIIEEKDGAAGRILTGQGADRDAIYKVLMGIRGS